MITIKRKLFLPIIILILIPFLLWTPIRECLVIQYQNSGHVLAYIPLTEGEIFHIKYTHSIHLSDVVDSFYVTKDRKMKQYQLMFEDFAIGMPANASEGEIFEQKNGKYFIKNMNRILPAFDLRIGKVRANHTVIFNKKEYPLTQIIEPGTWVRIKVERVNLWQQWKGVNILE